MSIGVVSIGQSVSESILRNEPKSVVWSDSIRSVFSILTPNFPAT